MAAAYHCTQLRIFLNYCRIFIFKTVFSLSTSTTPFKVILVFDQHHGFKGNYFVIDLLIQLKYKTH